MKKGIIFGVIGLVLLGGGVGAGMFLGKGSAEETEHVATEGEEIAAEATGEHGEPAASGDHSGGGAEPAEGEEAPKLNYDFEHPFAVNLLDENTRWFVSIYLQVEATTPEVVAKIKENVAPLRDTIITLLSMKTREEVRSAEGKRRLKKEIILRLESILGPGSINTVYFTDFSVHYN